MDKKRLSRIPRKHASAEMLETAERLNGLRHIMTAELDETGKILIIYAYRISELKKGHTEAEFRTFLSDDDYITQKLNTDKVKWLTASFRYMEYMWNNGEDHYRECVYIWSPEDKKRIQKFFSKYAKKGDNHSPWTELYRFQDTVMDVRLNKRRKKETDAIDAVMEPFQKPPKEFIDWVWEHGMSFSRYLIYKETEKGKAECECTHCKKIGIVSRKDIRLRNNEKGVCPFCGSRVTFKAKGRMPGRINDDRWFMYIDPIAGDFTVRYFHAVRTIKSDNYISVTVGNKNRVEEEIFEFSRAIYTFRKGKPEYKSYEWGVYKQRGALRWCPDQGRIACMECILYPGNLPEAWDHTPMKYSALEVLAENIPTISLRYEDAIKKYMEFPKLEWLCKMGLNKLAREVINSRYSGSMLGSLNFKGKTIYEILGLTKINTRILQALDGDSGVLRLLQVSQEINLQFKPEQLHEYYETFKCNTELLKQAKRKASLHKIVKYITKESEKYPIGDRGCWRYSYMRHTERTDPRIGRKQNMAKDWLEYLDWCKKLKYDLDNMFIYMPKNFKAVHDRTYKEYQAQQDKIAAEEKRRREAAVKRAMEKTKKALQEILLQNQGKDAFSIQGKGLLLIVPKNADEIREEGATLHHCVGTYVERVARGETNIFFVRKADAPDIPYYTLEWRGNDIVQCRGSRNCDMTPEVKAFVEAFKRKMLDSIMDESQKKSMRRCG